MKIMFMAILTLAFLAAFVVPVPVHAADDFEITPFIGYTMGGEFRDVSTGSVRKIDENGNYGIMFDIKQTDDSQIELYYSRQQTRLQAVGGLFASNPLFDLDVQYFHLGGTYGTGSGNVRPFVVGTFGATHLDPRGARLDAATKFSLSLGGGLKILTAGRIGLRLEGRWFGTFFNGAGEMFCADGSCAIKAEGDVISQVVVNAGLAITF